MPFSVCKKEAKLRLKSRKLRAFRISLCIFAIGLLSGVGAFFMPQQFSADARDQYLLCALQVLLCLWTIAALGTMRQGRAAWLYCCACGREPSGIQFLYWMRKGRGFTAAFLYMIIRIKKAARTILLCTPGVAVIVGGILYSDRYSGTIRYIAWIGGAVCLLIGLFFSGLINQKYALAPILYARAPQKGVRSAVRGSCFLMDESCMRLFLLKLSFLPWAIPCLALMPLVYVVPYYQQTTTCLLRDILRAHTI